MVIKRWYLIPLAVLVYLCMPARASAQYFPLQGWCETGNTQVTTSGLQSTTLVQASYPQCTVHVYLHGGGDATLYSTSTGTPLANPTTGSTSGYWEFYVAPGRYDVALSGGLPAPGFPTTVTLSDLQVGTGGGTGCQPPGNDLGVLTEHPAGSCYDSLNFTWDDTNHVLLAGNPVNTTASSPSMSIALGPVNSLTSGADQFIIGLSNALTNCVDCYITGEQNTITEASSRGQQYVLGNINTLTNPAAYNHVVGKGNSVNADTDSIIGGDVLIGTSNSLTATNASQIVSALLIGLQNTITVDDGGSTGFPIYVVGSRNAITATGMDGIADLVGIFGDDNTVTATDVDLSDPTVIVGAHNTFSGVNTTALGSGIFGNSLTLDSCQAANGCFMYGMNGTLTNQAVDIVTVGVSTLPEIEITPGSVILTYLAGGGTQCLQVINTGAITGAAGACGTGGSGSVTSFSAGNLSPLFTTSVATSTTTPALTFALSNAAGGTVFGRSSGSTGAPSYTSTPVLGIPTSVLGTLGFAGSTSGTATITPQVAAGTPTLTLPNASGTFAVSASAPLAVDATTGNITCTACVRTDASATFGAFAYNFTSATSLTIPVSAGATTAAVGRLAYDSTANNFHGYNGADSILGIFDATAITNGDCVQITKTGSKVQLTDAGGACGMGSSAAFSSLTNGTNTMATMHVGTGASLDATGSGTIHATTSDLATAMLFSGLSSATNTTAAMVIGTGASLAATGSGTITATAAPFAGLSAGTNTTAAMLVGTGASLATTGTGTITANRLPVGAAFTTTGNGQIGYDTTSLNWHVWNAGADDLLGVWDGIPATGDCVVAAVSAGSITLHDSGGSCGGLPSTGSTGIVVQVSPTSTVARAIAVSSPLTVTNANGTAGNPTVACATCTTDTNTQTFTNKMISQEGTGNAITTVWSAYADAAACNVSTAGTDWDLLGTTIPAAACLTGTNTQQGTLNYDDAMNEFGQFKLALPTLWTGNIDILLYWTVTTGGGSNAVKWTVQTACTAPGATYDTSFNAAQTITTNVAANNITTTSQQLAVTTTSCTGGALMHLKIGRDTTDTFTGTARMIGARVSGRRTGE